MHLVFKETAFHCELSLGCIFVTTHSEWLSSELKVEESQNQVTDIQTHTCIYTKVSVLMKSLGQIQSQVSVSQLTFKSCISQAFRQQYVLLLTYCISNKDVQFLSHTLYICCASKNKLIITKKVEIKSIYLAYILEQNFRALLQKSSFDVFYLTSIKNKPRIQGKPEFCTQISVWKLESF